MVGSSTTLAAASNPFCPSTQISIRSLRPSVDPADIVMAYSFQFIPTTATLEQVKIVKYRGISDPRTRFSGTNMWGLGMVCLGHGPNHEQEQTWQPRLQRAGM